MRRLRCGQYCRLACEDESTLWVRAQGRSKVAAERSRRPAEGERIQPQVELSQARFAACLQEDRARGQGEQDLLPAQGLEPYREKGWNSAAASAAAPEPARAPDLPRPLEHLR